MAKFVLSEPAVCHDASHSLLQPFERLHEAFLAAWSCGYVKANRLPMAFHSQHFISGKILRGMVSKVSDSNPLHCVDVVLKPAAE